MLYVDGFTAAFDTTASIFHISVSKLVIFQSLYDNRMGKGKAYHNISSRIWKVTWRRDHQQQKLLAS